MNECGHDGWVKGCQRCEENERAATVAMGEHVDRHDCRVCGYPCGSENPWTLDLLGRAAHVTCLEDAGVWNARPTEED